MVPETADLMEDSRVSHDPTPHAVFSHKSAPFTGDGYVHFCTLFRKYLEPVNPGNLDYSRSPAP